MGSCKLEKSQNYLLFDTLEDHLLNADEVGKIALIHIKFLIFSVWEQTNSGGGLSRPVVAEMT